MRIISRANNLEHGILVVSFVISLLLFIFEIRLLHRKEQLKMHMILHNGLQFHYLYKILLTEYYFYWTVPINMIMTVYSHAL